MLNNNSPIETITLVLALVISVLFATNASAVPTRSDGGGKCDKTGTARKVGKDEQGNSLDCKWQTCTYQKCNTTNNKLSGCRTITEYSEPTDCKPARKLNYQRGQKKAPRADKMAPTQKPRRFQQRRPRQNQRVIINSN